MGKKKGIDISYHQKTIDFDRVKKAGIKFVILRSSYRKTIDPKFLTYVKQCKEAGIPVIGVYHFIYALTKKEALNEAKFCVECIEKAGLGKDLYVFADFEYDTVTKAKAKGVTLGKKECNSFTKEFCDYVTKCGYKTGIYTNNDYRKNWYDKSLLDSHALWLADYTGDPDVPCVFQQYSNVGRVNGISTNVDLDYYFEEEIKMAKTYSRQKVVDLVKSWEGLKEKDGSYKKIIDIYNSYDGKFPRSIKMQYGWAWCACTWSAIAIKLNYTDIMPIEISCNELVKKAKEMDIWVEKDKYVAKPGDAVLYDWDDDGKGNDTGWPDHVGTIIETHEKDGYFIVMEGNYSDSVKRRKLEINGKYIRGFITPKYTDNAVSSSEPAKKEEKKEESSSSKAPSKKIKWKGVVTASSLNVRTWAGKENPRCSFGPLPKGTKVDVCDTVKSKDGVDWYYIIKNGRYGFVSSRYIKKA